MKKDKSLQSKAEQELKKAVKEVVENHKKTVGLLLFGKTGRLKRFHFDKFVYCPA